MKDMHTPPYCADRLITGVSAAEWDATAFNVDAFKLTVPSEPHSFLKIKQDRRNRRISFELN